MDLPLGKLQGHTSKTLNSLEEKGSSAQAQLSILPCVAGSLERCTKEHLEEHQTARSIQELLWNLDAKGVPDN